MKETRKGIPSATPEEARIHLASLSKYLVCITGFQRITEGPERNEEPTPFALTGFLIDYRSMWFIATAGHVIDMYEKAKACSSTEITNTQISDFFGEGTEKKKYPMPFDPLDRAGYVDDDLLKLDCGIIPVRDIYRKNFSQNGVAAYPIEDRSRDQLGDYEGFYLIGFPESRVKPAEGKGEYSSGILLRQVMVPLKSKRGDTDNSEDIRFKAEVQDLGDIGSVKGMSGGPIFGIRTRDGKLYYDLVAIQGSKSRDNKYVYGCPANILRDALNRAYEIVQKGRQKPEDDDRKS